MEEGSKEHVIGTSMDASLEMNGWSMSAERGVRQHISRLYLATLDSNSNDLDILTHQNISLQKQVERLKGQLNMREREVEKLRREGGEERERYAKLLSSKFDECERYERDCEQEAEKLMQNEKEGVDTEFLMELKNKKIASVFDKYMKKTSKILMEAREERELGEVEREKLMQENKSLHENLMEREERWEKGERYHQKMKQQYCVLASKNNLLNIEFQNLNHTHQILHQDFTQLEKRANWLNQQNLKLAAENRQLKTLTQQRMSSIVAGMTTLASSIDSVSVMVDERVRSLFGRVSVLTSMMHGAKARPLDPIATLAQTLDTNGSIQLNILSPQRAPSPFFFPSSANSPPNSMDHRFSEVPKTHKIVNKTGVKGLSANTPSSPLGSNSNNIKLFSKGAKKEKENAALQITAQENFTWQLHVFNPSITPFSSLFPTQTVTSRVSSHLTGQGEGASENTLLTAPPSNQKSSLEGDLTNFHSFYDLYRPILSSLLPSDVMGLQLKELIGAKDAESLIQSMTEASRVNASKIKMERKTNARSFATFVLDEFIESDLCGFLKVLWKSIVDENVQVISESQKRESGRFSNGDEISNNDMHADNNEKILSDSFRCLVFHLLCTLYEYYPGVIVLKKFLVDQTEKREYEFLDGVRRGRVMENLAKEMQGALMISPLASTGIGVNVLGDGIVKRKKSVMTHEAGESEKEEGREDGEEKSEERERDTFAGTHSVVEGEESLMAVEEEYGMGRYSHRSGKIGGSEDNEKERSPPEPIAKKDCSTQCNNYEYEDWRLQSFLAATTEGREGNGERRRRGEEKEEERGEVRRAEESRGDEGVKKVISDNRLQNYCLRKWTEKWMSGGKESEIKEIRQEGMSVGERLRALEEEEENVKGAVVRRKREDAVVQSIQQQQFNRRKMITERTFRPSQ